jgi:hypothetical protein
MEILELYWGTGAVFGVSANWTYLLMQTSRPVI